MTAKLGRRWWLLVGLVLALLLQGCGFTPGLQVKAGPEGFFRGTPTEPEQEEDYVLIPVNERMIAKMEAESQPVDREIPAEWKIENADYEYRVGSNDLLQIIVWDHPELSLQGTASDLGNPMAGPASPAVSANPGLGIQVNQKGNMYFPFVGSVHVAGRTAEEIRELVRTGLSRYVQDPQVDVRVIGFRSKRVHVAGEVQNPRDVAITDVPLRLVDAINAAGGTAGRQTSNSSGTGVFLSATLKPDLEEVHVIRKGREITVSLLDIYDKGQVEDNILLQDGDIIHVPNLDAKKIYVMGEVGQQGLQAFERGRLTLASALQRSGGIRQESAEGTRTLVIRRGKTKPLAYYFNMNEPETLVAATRFPLKPSDVVYVATADIAKFQRVVQAFIPIMQYAIYGAAFAAR